MEFEFMDSVSYCDSRIASECSVASDFSLQIGTLTASGVECMLADPRLKKNFCDRREQKFFG